MTDLDIHILRTFIVVAGCKNFTLAAERLGLTQSAVTQQVKKLEERLGVTLLHRSKRKVALSLDGELLLEQAKQMVTLHDRLVGQFQNFNTEGEVKFGSPEDFATHFLPEILGEFVRSHPNIKLTVNCELTLTLLQGFEKGDYDLIIIKQRPGEVHPGAQVIWHENLVWVGSLLDTLTPGKLINLAISPEPCVYRQCAMEALNRAGLGWQISYTSPSVAGLIAAVQAGLGITVLPRNVVPEGLLLHPSTGLLPPLGETRICMLTRPNPNKATLALGEYIQILIGTKNK